MDENQDIRNALMKGFNLTEADRPAQEAKPPKLQEAATDPVLSDVPPTGDGMYEPQGETPSVSEMLSQVCKNSDAERKKKTISEKERKRIQTLCINEEIIGDILGA